MKATSSLVLMIISFACASFAQGNIDLHALFKAGKLTSVNVLASEETYQGRNSLKVLDNSENTEVKYVKLKDLDFKNGTIEIDMSGKPSATASEQARGFVGIAFRIGAENEKFECIYLRPTNGRAEDQVRRNHSVQYISYPDFPWQKLRKEFPEKYEAYVDLVSGEWTKVKIEVKGDKAKLYVHGQTQPTLIVNDLKHGGEGKGSIGLWVGPGTEAYFANLRVTALD